MIGFVTNKGLAEQVLAAIHDEQESQGLPYYWTVGSYPILSGEHEGKVFLPASDDLLDTPLRHVGGSQLTPRNSPRFGALIKALGGLDARVELDPNLLTTKD